MSRDPPPESRYYRERRSDERRPTHIPNQKPEAYLDEPFEDVDYAECGHYAEYVDYSDDEPEHHTTEYEKAPAHSVSNRQSVPLPQPVPVPQPLVCAEKAALAGLPLPTVTAQPRRSRFSGVVRNVFLLGLGVLSLSAYIVGTSYKQPFGLLPTTFPLSSSASSAPSSESWPAQFSVPSLPKDFVKKCHDLLEAPKGTYTSRLDKLGSKLGDAYVFVAEPGTTASYYLGGFGPGSWSKSERPFLVAVNQTGDVTILTPRFEEARARLEQLPAEVQKRTSWAAWDESQSPYAVLSAHLGRPRWVFDGEVRSFIADGLLRLSPRGPDERKESDRILRAVMEIRERKEPREIELLRCANQFTLHAIRKTRARMKLGITEGQTREILYEEMKATGLKDYGALVLFGENAALPHGSGTEAKLGKHDFALIDAGGRWGGYVADITRTFFLPDSEISDEHQDVWEIVRSAQRAPSNFLHMTTPEEPAFFSWLDDRARETVKKGMAYLGVPPKKGGEPDYTVFTHRLGHGIGLDGHESPYVVQGPLGERPVLTGHTFSQEPGVYIPKGGVGMKEVQGLGVRLEDCGVVVEDKEGRLRFDWFTGPVERWGDV